MRDRRNTNLSLSSTSSSPTSGAHDSSRSSRDEKRAWTSPPLSPTNLLLSPVVRSSSRSSRLKWMAAVRWLAVFVACILLWNHCSSSPPLPDFLLSLAGGSSDQENDARASGLLSNISLPAGPAAVVVSDKSGAYRRWTVSIPPSRGFPLEGYEYEELCTQCEALRESLAPASRLFQKKLKTEEWQGVGGLYAVDRSFLDVDRAERLGVLPASSNPANGSSRQEEVCERSLTFTFDANEASFGKSLLLLWMSYGLAKKENRAFFIDDSRWGYGTYLSYFTPPPSPGCAPPPPQQIVPCPHTAKHLVISSATAPWSFGQAFERTFARSLPHAGAEKSRKIYDLLRVGYEDLFHLVGEDAAYAASRGGELRKKTIQAGMQRSVAVHIRRGDRHPVEYQFARDYLPLERYAEAARKFALGSSSSFSPLELDLDLNLDDDESGDSPYMLVASDDPAILSSPELAQAAHPLLPQQAQSRIQLATKAHLLQDAAAAAASPKEFNPFANLEPSDASWEGGFYRALFFSLGRPSSKFNLGSGAASTSSGLTGGSVARNSREGLSQQGLRLRHLVGRAYLLDLAALAQADGVVCAVSSASCRVLGVMVGWEGVAGGSASGSGQKGKGKKAVAGKRWINVDDGRAWSWDGRRV